MKYRSGWVAIVVSSAAALSACGSREAAAPPDYAARGQQDWEHVKVLADDAMEGRRAGTPGHRRAAEYVAEQFKAAGLAPGGDDGYFQRVNLESRKIREDLSSLALVTPRGVEPLKLGDDAVIGLRGNFADGQVEAPIVFVGHGLRLPQYGHDDLTGVDLKGKIVAYFTSAPKSVPGAAGAHFGSPSERWKEYHAAGAVGVLTIPNPHVMEMPWERSAAARTNPTMRLAAPAADLFPGQQVWASINPARFARLLAGTGQSEQDLLATLEKGEALPHFDLKVRLRAKTAADIATAASENVVGVLRGSDESLASEYVVLSAHLDHLGISEKGEGDRLNNGAIDNASGVASLIETARRLHAAGVKPKRSIVFVAVTAEESGLLGSRAYAENAAANGTNIVANINSDMYMPIYPLKRLIVFGLDESSLGEDARAVAAGLGIEPIVDPQPQRNRFIRSDQYSFIRTGVPALSLKIGFAPGSPEEKIDQQWYKDRYHSPSDDLSQPVDFTAMGLYGEYLQRLTLRVADAEQAPAWRDSSVFATIPRAAAAAAK